MAKLTVYIHVYKHSGKLIVLLEKSPNELFLYVGEHSFDYELPADFDPVKAEIAAMTEEIARTRAESQAKVTRLQGRINDLLALPAPEAA